MEWRTLLPKQKCIEDTTLWLQFGCPRVGDINSYRTGAKLKYKNAVKLAAQNVDTCLNDKLLNYMCSKDTSTFEKPGERDFVWVSLNQLKL